MKSVIVLLSLALGASVLSAQTANLSGFVKDSSGGVIRSAAVRISSKLTGVTRSGVTNEKGLYSFPKLPTGIYDVEASAAGFKSQMQADLTLSVAQEAEQNFTLDLGSTRETVTVEATASLTQTLSASTGTVIDNNKVVELPLNGRQFYSLALLSPGALPPAQNSTIGYKGGFNVAGSRETDNNYTLNGIDNNDETGNAPAVRPSVDAIQEFKLLTGIYSAEYGRSSGGQIVVVTKSGSNHFHGTLFEFLRNQDLDAANFFTAAGAKPTYKQNDFGGTIGGPIRKDKTFFFFNYEGLRLRQQVVVRGTVPTAAMQKGDFSSLLALAKPIVIKNPLTGDTFPNNVIPQSLISPIGAALIGYYPAPTSPTPAGVAPTNNFTLNGARKETLNEYNGRVDHYFSQRDSLSAVYNYYNDPSFEVSVSLCGSTALPGFGCNQGNQDQQLSLAEYHIFSPTLLNELRLGVGRAIVPRIQQDSAINFWGPFGVTNAFLGAATNNEGLPSTSITGYSRLGGASNLPQDRWNTTYVYSDALSWQRGGHSLKIGGELRVFDGNQYIVISGRGTLSFTGAATAPTSGYPLADLLLGVPTSTSNNPYAPISYNREKALGLFVQDDWKVTPTLTLNLGMRWELNTPWKIADNQISSFTLGTGLIRVAGQNGTPANLYQWDYHNFAPRLGVAWQPFGDSRTVIRAGAGIFYQIFSGNGFTSLTTNPPMRQPTTFNSSLANPITLNNPFPAAAVAGGAITAAGVTQDFTTPSAFEWSFGIQRQLTRDMLVDVTYFAAKGTHLPLDLNVNQPLPGPGTLSQVNARRPYPAFGNTTMYESVGNSEYQSLQFKFEKRLSRGISFLASDTYGKSIDDSSSWDSSSDASRALPQNSYNLAAERGRSDFDIHNRFVLSAVAELPFGSGKPWATSGLASKLAGGWEASAIMADQTGPPTTPYISANISNTYGGTDRPNVVGNPNSGPHTLSAWVNSSALALPASGTFGNAGRNILQAPGLFNLDFALNRNFRIREGLRLQFRGEMFNILNHPNFGLPASTFDSPTFGSIAIASASRQIQFALKLIF